MGDTFSSKEYGDEILERLEELGVIERGHFVGKDCQHSKVRVEKDLLFPSVTDIRDFAEIISLELVSARIDTVIGAGPMGAALANQVADWLNVSGQSAFAIYAERTSGRGRVLEIPKAQRRFIDTLQRVAIVTGILDDGFDEGQMVQMVRDLKGDLWGIAAIWNSGGLTARDRGLENIYSISGEEFTTWDEADCPLCNENRPFTK